MTVAGQLYLVAPAISDAALAAAVRGGVDLVQLRLKDASDEEILATAARFRAVLDPLGVPLIINDRPDLARAAGAAGVHVGQDDQAVSDARAIVGADAIVGLSTHTPEQVDAAADLPLDYFAVGPVYATPTKPGRPAVGTELVRYAAARAQLPFFAIGGIDPTNLAVVRDAGAERIAVVRAITQAPDPERAARALAHVMRRDVEPA
ncbi:MAG TPA: thiamine phosphate synthase [Solirubrobacteraceae bacterium]|nr:thiamine phosphate synthase [Solirubrobacteraceae bacterium]